MDKTATQYIEGDTMNKEQNNKEKLAQDKVQTANEVINILQKLTSEDIDNIQNVLQEKILNLDKEQLVKLFDEYLFGTFGEFISKDTFCNILDIFGLTRNLGSFPKIVYNKVANY